MRALGCVLGITCLSVLLGAQTWYTNHVTGEMTWTRPVGVVDPPPAAAAPIPPAPLAELARDRAAACRRGVGARPAVLVAAAVGQKWSARAAASTALRRAAGEGGAVAEAAAPPAGASDTGEWAEVTVVDWDQCGRTYYINTGSGARAAT